MVGGRGVEPRPRAPEARMLPIHTSPRYGKASSSGRGRIVSPHDRVGGPDRLRTCGLLRAKQALSRTELQAHNKSFHAACILGPIAFASPSNRVAKEPRRVVVVDIRPGVQQRTAAFFHRRYINPPEREPTPKGRVQVRSGFRTRHSFRVTNFMSGSEWRVGPVVLPPEMKLLRVKRNGRV